MKYSIALSFLAFAHYGLANERSGPAVTPQDTSPLGARALLEKRDTCEGGGSCIVGQCCGDGCAMNCCGVDMNGGGVGCNIGATCDYANESVFIGCCMDFLGRGCTGTPTMVTLSTIYGDYTPTNEATTTTTRESTFTSTSADEPTETETPTLPTATQTSLPTATLTNSDDEDPFETGTDDDTTTTRPTSSADDDDFSFPSETTTSDDSTDNNLTPTLTAETPQPTESDDAASVVHPSLWFIAGLGALLAF
ncbi:hypothetical protein BJX68DRAFT_226181 [Aspergillus pseudodeflectus]|uniref:GPI anchored protein n=1 Tax=Aspergillus pseudodeflectus TaxID=176178 RepID=A0ABR4L4A0_9EURO